LIVERTDFVSVPVRDLEKSTAWYRDRLGLEQVGTGGWPEFQMGENVSLYLIDLKNVGREFREPHTAYIALRSGSAMSRSRAGSSRDAASSSRATSSTPASATWPSSTIPTATR
jgi:catechol 2,3-dioxygenase-like lactoylglutathione lyase family enzyme